MMKSDNFMRIQIRLERKPQIDQYFRAIEKLNREVGPRTRATQKLAVETAIAAYLNEPRA